MSVTTVTEGGTPVHVATDVSKDITDVLAAERIRSTDPTDLVTPVSVAVRGKRGRIKGAVWMTPDDARAFAAKLIELAGDA